MIRCNSKKVYKNKTAWVIWNVGKVVVWQRVPLAELSVDVYNKHNLSYGYSGKLYDTSDITNDNVLGVFDYILRGENVCVK